ncbi:MAG: D-alanyl-D-alanine carboxypeptidase/D-alanyl-D-alanine-endopeptidase [Bacteroidetes bacterium]|nr:D-alanyl-D-alanine carboxypeptidase/D-alanyl-D-alanine-endopeptidase [Bacteroidota bacterium]
MKSYLLVAILLIFSEAKTQNTFFNNWLNSKAFKNASIGVMIYDLDKDSVLLSNDAEKNLISASTMKLVTTAAALKVLGPEFQFKTELAYTDSALQGVLHGNLIINGFGDPTLGSKYFYDDPKIFLKQWIDAIKKLGITSVDGDIVANDSYLGSSPAPYDWLWSDISNYYGSPARGLNVFDNQYSISFATKSAGTKAEIISVNPTIPYLKLNSKVMASEEQQDNAYILGGPLEFQKEVEGTIPANKASFKIKGAIPDPALFLAFLIYEELKKNGIAVKGTYKSTREKPAENSRVFYTHLSPTLKEIIAVTNKQSNNLFAEACGAAIKMKTSKADFQKAIDYSLKNCGFDQALLKDACGLSPMNALSAKNFTLLMKSMYSDKKIFLPYKESLSVSGVDGTLKNFGNLQNFTGKFYGKSGSMSGVKSYAGYLKSTSGKNIIVVIIANHYSSESSAIKEKSEELINHVFLNY